VWAKKGLNTIRFMVYCSPHRSGTRQEEMGTAT
jgi:hypothetical protein